MKRLFLMAVPLMAMFMYPGTAAAKTDESRSVDVDGLQRRYILYIPDNVAPTAPLVVSLHGAAGHDTDHSPFKPSVADEVGCIVAYPQGENQNFGPFGTVPGWNSTGEDNEEIRFLKAVIEDVASQHPVDRQRIYCCGFSNGGMMTYAAAQAAPDVFAAFASISGFPLNEFHHRHCGARPVPFLHIHGKSDDFVRYSLMPVIRDNMVARNGCTPIPETSSVAGRYDRSDYNPAVRDEGMPYVYIEVDGMWHADFTDKTAEGNSAMTMWRFFERFCLDDPCDRSLKYRFAPDAGGFDPSAHGWKIDSSRKWYEYGTARKPGNADQNVYRTLQFEKGDYSLAIKSRGTVGNRFRVRLENLDDGSTVFNKDVEIGKDAVLPFAIDKFGEFRMILEKDSPDDLLDEISIHSVGLNGVVSAEYHSQNSQPEMVYNISGQPLSGVVPGEICIVVESDGKARKILAW